MGGGQGKPVSNDSAPPKSAWVKPKKCTYTGPVSKEDIAIFLTMRHTFFRGWGSTNCSISDYSVCPDVDKIFDIDRLKKAELVKLSDSISVSAPVISGLNLPKDNQGYYISISENGILALGYGDNYKLGEPVGNIRHAVMFIDLFENKTVEVETENATLAGFYDDSVILLTWGKPLRAAFVNDVFTKNDLSVFMKLGDVENVTPQTDVSILNASRNLFYTTMDSKLFCFNVDAERNEEIDIKMNIKCIASLTGIYCGVEAFLQNDHFGLYFLDSNFVATEIEKRELCGYVRSIFPSTDNSENLDKAVFRCLNCIITDKGKISLTAPVTFDWNYSLIRIYKNIFLYYDRNLKEWVISKIVVS